MYWVGRTIKARSGGRQAATQAFSPVLDNRGRTKEAHSLEKIGQNEAERGALQALRRGDLRGLELLVGLYQLEAVRTAYGLVADRQVAEDVVADAFLLVYERIGQYDEARPFAPWFYRIVVNCALKVVRGQDRIERAPNGKEWADERVSEAPGPEQEAEHQELRVLLQNLLSELPAVQRATIVLRYYLDMDEATIAATLDCPLGTVKWRLHTAKAKLREKLLPQAGLLLGDGEG